MSRDVVSDFLTSIRNAIAVKKRSAVVPHSKFKVEIAKALKEEGYIVDFQVVEAGSVAEKSLKLQFKYVKGHSAISQIARVSKQGRRVYVKGSELKRGYRGGLGVYLLSTNQGVISDVQARSGGLKKDGNLVGGEVLCSVW